MSGGHADIVLTNGRIWTGIHGSPDESPSSIAVKHGTVAAVGDDALAGHWTGVNTRVVDLDGRRAVPGLIDSHIHAVRAGASYLDELDWTEVTSLRDALETLRAAARTRPAGTWIPVLGGWHPSQFRDEPRMPTREELDATCPDHPAFVHPLYGHEDHGVLNSRALAELGWTGQCADPDGGTLGRADDGSPDGRLAGVAAYQHVMRAALQPGPERAAESTTAFFARLAALGLTGVIDAGGLGMTPEKYHALRAIWRRGALPIRVRTNVGATSRGNEPAEVAAWQEMLDPAFGDDLLAVLGIGEVLHFGCHDWEGMVPFEIDDAAHGQLVSILEAAARGRWPVTIHAILDSSISRVLDAMERVAQTVPIGGLRWSICHSECIGSANLRRVKDLGIALALQGRVAQKARVCASRWGEQVMSHAPPLGDIVELGIPFGAGTDATRGASYNPWRSLWWFVTGKSVDDGPRRAERHRLDRATALDAYTRGSAWLSFEEGRRGVLEPGYQADVAVLSDDYFAMAEDDIPALASDLTLVAGRVVHRSAAFESVPLQRHPGRPAPDGELAPGVPAAGSPSGATLATTA
ncbi:amidohydrolase [Phytoactinopolyspora halophila]|nr:amidohydrolase [Phytoactinopolyspora halophila]